MVNFSQMIWIKNGLKKVLVLGLFFPLLGESPPPSSKTIPMAAIAQRHRYWCWAASLETVAKYYGMASQTQSNIVNTVLELTCDAGGSGCSIDELPNDCNRTISISQFEHIDLSFFIPPSPPLSVRWKSFERNDENLSDYLSFVKTQITNNKPVITLIPNPIAVGAMGADNVHAVICRGYNTSRNQVFIQDPFNFTAEQCSSRRATINIRNKTYTNSKYYDSNRSFYVQSAQEIYVP